jgi:hypothetical protein
LPRADQVPHEGTPRTTAQNSKLYGLKEKCGGVFSGDDDSPKSLWRMKVLGVYRDEKGERITSSKSLSQNQAGHLIERMWRYVRKVEENHARMEASAPESIEVLKERHGIETTPADLLEALHDVFVSHVEETEWLNTLGFADADAIPPESRLIVSQLAAAWRAGPDVGDAYREMLQKARALGHVTVRP